MKGKLIWSIFWALVGVFVIVVGGMFTTQLNFPPIVRPILFLTSWALFLLLGITLLVLTLKEKVAGMLKAFLLLTGASAVGGSASFVLHNLVSGWLGIEEAVFFILATIVCPLGFLTGAIGSIVLFVKKPWLLPKSPSRRR